MTEYKVVIPKEHFQVIEFIQDSFPGIASVNLSLKNFEPKQVFSWHCSVMIFAKDTIENGMPSENETEVLSIMENFLDDRIKGDNKEKPNGLFLAGITWNRTRELIWRIFDPKLANDFLSELINKKDYLREFDYRIDSDKEWKLAEWHLNNIKL